jgi:PPK2 family polyphosphate:nucleotide phosphotransferase
MTPNSTGKGSIPTDFGERFRVQPGSHVHLDRIDPSFDGPPGTEKNAASMLDADKVRLHELQAMLYAERKHSLLICLQGMDTSGKDGTISHIFGAMNPQGCRVAAFKAPTAEELAHDFLWRIHKEVPATGEVVVFNRSHYEDVLVARVHRLVAKGVWSARYDQINSFEEALVEQGTHIVKFFLHISKREQLKRLKDRIDDPSKHWKLSETDYAERKHWEEYARAYEELLSRCSTKHAPWYVVPADHKWFRNLAIARIVVGHLEGLKMRYPEPTVDLDQMRREFREAERS